MKAETYEYLWENALEKAIQDVLLNIPEEVQEKNKLSYLDDFESKKGRIVEEYEIQRRKVRDNFFDVGKDGKNLIDIHKVCSCFTAAVLKVRIFDFEQDVDAPMNMSVFYSNYTVAFLTGIHIMYLCLLSDFSKKEDKKLYNLLYDQASFIFPETNEGHDEYLQGRVKTLALNDIYEIDFDILTYADMLYWIEKYNKDHLLSQIKK